MRLRLRHLSSVAAACAVAVPSGGAPAHGQVPTTASVVASDFQFDAAGGGPPDVSVAFGGEVGFAYPAGASTHQVVFTGPQPTFCHSGVPGGQVQGPRAPIPDHPYGPGWTAGCTFTYAGTYPFICSVHPAMTGSVTAVDTGGPAPAPPRWPGLGDIPAASSLRLARAQRGTTIRGSLIAARAGSSLVVRAYARRGALYGGRSTRDVRVARQLLAPVHGRTAFAAPLTAVARRALRRAGRLAIGVRITVTPPAGGGPGYSATRSVVVRPAQLRLAVSGGDADDAAQGNS